MKLYTIDHHSYKLHRQTTMPIKSDEELKWFGFSHEGGIFNHDSS
jgi:hypothetical protein